jgi:alkylated DNA nucleotide flippase Atl1
MRSEETSILATIPCGSALGAALLELPVAPELLAAPEGPVAPEPLAAEEGPAPEPPDVAGPEPLAGLPLLYVFAPGSFAEEAPAWGCPGWTPPQAERVSEIAARASGAQGAGRLLALARCDKTLRGSVGGRAAMLAGVIDPEGAAASAIFARIREIPEGFVRTYGDVSPGAPRMAGAALAACGDTGVPWHRVVRADGSLAKGARQRALLEAEGIPFRGERVEMRVARLPF